MTPQAVAAHCEYLAKRLRNGCGNHGCIVNPPQGMGTNSVCQCQPAKYAQQFMGLAIECERIGQIWDNEGGAK